MDALPDFTVPARVVEARPGRAHRAPRHRAVGARLGSGQVDVQDEGHGEQEATQHEQRPEGRVDVAQPVAEPGQGQDGRGSTEQGPDQAADLWQRPGSEPEDGRDDDEGDGDQIERIHAGVARGRLRPPPPANRCGPGGAPPRRRSRVPCGAGSRVRPCPRGSSVSRTGRCRSPGCFRPAAGPPAPRGRS